MKENVNLNYQVFLLFLFCFLISIAIIFFVVELIIILKVLFDKFKNYYKSKINIS